MFVARCAPASVLASELILLGCATGLILLTGAAPAPNAATQPESFELTGLLRDLRAHSNQDGGHPDMGQLPESGFGHYAGNMDTWIGADGTPLFTGFGFKVMDEWRDSQGRAICHLLFDPLRGDTPGVVGPADTGGIESAVSFDAWFHDVPHVNLSQELTLTLVRQKDGNYVFDDTTDPDYAPLGGFFPLEDQLYGNSGGNPDRNFHFTFELHTEFTYDASAGQYFQFTGGDDVWVYINDQLVIDLGGVHAAMDQIVELDRLGLVDGATYPLDFFFAERHRTESNFRINTNLVLDSIDPPGATSAVN